MLHRFIHTASARLLFLLITTLCSAPTVALELKSDPQAAIAEAERAIRQFQAPADFTIDLFAAEPQLANPVAFFIDEWGRIYVSETYRYRTGVLDVREHMHLFDDDLAAKTVEDRQRVLEKHYGAKMDELTRDSEIVRLIEDRDGDGRADFSTVFADGFNTALDGIASGVLARKGDVWFANIPHLWRLRDTTGDGTADVRQSLSYGYGVHFNLTGHDLHGLIFGPDGRLYFSIGDRGLRVTTKEGRLLDYPDMGTVLRCDPDGSNLEVFAFGVRNPQELAFDDYGNLFTGDNNCDHGDRARLVHVVEGGDSGWRVGYQFNEHNPAGPWNAEKLWHLQFEGQAAYILPPIAHIGNGPSGFAYYPGTGFPDRYQGHFFLCDFKGAAANSGVHTFALEPRGATFEMTGLTNFLWNILVTDVDFGPDGRMYVTDWVHGWPQSFKGRIYRIYDPERINSAAVVEVKRLFANGFSQRSSDELAALLAHPNQRVRLEAQFALAERGDAALNVFEKVAREEKHQLARLHAIWGLGQLGRKDARAYQPLLPLLRDNDAEVRAQVAKVLGEGRVARSFDGLVKLLKDERTRARFQAAMSLGKLGDARGIGPVFNMLRANADEDVYLRHAGVMALAGINDIAALKTAALHPSRSVRMAALLAMRKLERPEAALFLNDADPLVVVEAARAINDVPIPAAMPALANKAAQAGHFNPAQQDEEIFTALWRRVVNANYRLGTDKNAAALASLATNETFPEKLRAEAIDLLGTWPKPHQRDRILGVWRPLEPRSAQAAADAARPVLPSLFKASPEPVRIAAARTAARLDLRESGPGLFAIVSESAAPAPVRVEALKALAALQDKRLGDALKLSAASDRVALRKEALRIQAVTDIGDAAAMITTVLANGTIPEKQAALLALGKLKNPAADGLLSEWLDRLIAGKVPAALQLELLEAAGERASPAIRETLERYQNSRSKEVVADGYRELLAGGDAETGRKIFLERPEASCTRCHKVNGEGGEAGPELTGIAAKKSREQLLEAILFPNREISEGFETILVSLNSGISYAGIVRHETDMELEIISPEDGLVKVKKADIASRDKSLSGMPEGLGQVLSKRDLRDLVEFLAELK